jgi:deoxyribonuclease-4
MKEQSETGGQARRYARNGKTPRIGAQISTAGGFGPVPERAAAIGAEAVQIFSSNPRTWQIRSIDPEVISAFASDLRERSLPLFFHTIYLINLASPDDELRRLSGKALAHALALGALAEAAGVVTHVGSHRGEGFERGCERVADIIHKALEIARDSLAAQGHKPALPPLLLETGAGAGAVVGSRLEELATLLATLPSGLGICLDTAHLFAAGYPVHEAGGLDSLIDELRDRGLYRSVGLVHLNDSTAPFASNRDRHENPGEGQIGYEGLARVVRHPALAHIPFVLEVPGADGHGPDAASLDVVKSMRAGEPAQAAVSIPPEEPARYA